MPRHHKVHELLDGDELAELEKFAREPGRTIDECLDWLLERQFNIGRTAVGNWKREFDALVLKERFSGSIELARSIKEAVAEKSFGDVADAAVMQLTQVVFEQAAILQANATIDPLDVQRMTRSLRNLVGSKADLMKQIAVKFDQEMQSRIEKSPNKTLSAADIAEASKMIFGVA